MNKSACADLRPSATKLDEESEEEYDPLMVHREKCIDEKYGRKSRWIVGVEKEDKRTTEKSLIASNRASSCREAINQTLNKDDAVKEYKNLLSNINNTCILNLKKIAEKKVRKATRTTRGRKTNILPAVAEKPRMSKEEYKLWRTEYIKKRFGVSSIPRWRGGTKKAVAEANIGEGFVAPKPAINKTFVQTRHAYTPCPAVRDLIQKTRSQMAERAKLLQVMKRDDDE